MTSVSHTAFKKFPYLEVFAPSLTAWFIIQKFCISTCIQKMCAPLGLQPSYIPGSVEKHCSTQISQRKKWRNGRIVENGNGIYHFDHQNGTKQYCKANGGNLESVVMDYATTTFYSTMHSPHPLLQSTESGYMPMLH